MTRLQQAQAHLEQAHRAFMQAPTPRLASAMKQLAGVIRYEKHKESHERQTAPA